MVANAICELDLAKATGLDCIISVLKMCFPELSPVLAKMYNKCLFESCFPSYWKFSSFVPAYKNDRERSDPGNYRPIKYLEGTGLFSDLLYGFRAFRSAAYLLAVWSERIYNSLDVGGETRAIALDVLKVFDKARHDGLAS